MTGKTLAQLIAEKETELEALRRQLREQRLSEADGQAETDAQRRRRLFGGDSPIGKAGTGGLYMPAGEPRTYGGNEQ